MQPNEVETIRLEDGRKLEYGEYGDRRSDKTVFYFHGLIGSHGQTKPAHDYAKEVGLRVIAWNRPGVGNSTADKVGGNILSRTRVVPELVNKLGIEEFGVVGISGGVPYALATGYLLKTRVKCITAISGVGPLADPELLQRLEPAVRLKFWLGKFPILTYPWFLLRMRCDKNNLEPLLEKIIESMPRIDQMIFRSRPELRAMFLADLKAVMIKGQGPKGIADEVRRLCGSWGFHLRDMPSDIPIELIHGRGDLELPAAMAAYMQSQMPGSTLSLPEGGHLIGAKETIMNPVLRNMHAVLNGRNT